MKNVWQLTLLIVLAGLFDGCQATPPPPTPQEQGRIGYEDARVVIDALTRFRKFRGAYPADLAALVPKYLPADTALIGEQYDLPRAQSLMAYRRKDDKEYELSFGLSDPKLPPQHYWYHTYFSRTGRWKVEEAVTLVTSTAKPPWRAQLAEVGLAVPGRF